jgi:F-type H+-transporting ATPase subunit epsilon
MSALQCIVVTPERTIRDQRADFVALPLYDGEIGIAPGRTPMIGRLGCGELRVRADDQTSRFYVEGGFVEVLNNVVTVLTNRAMPAEEVDAEVAEEQLRTIRTRRATMPDQFAQRDRVTALSRAQLRVARRARSTP